MNGISRDTNWSPQALDGEPRILWRGKIGAGFSSIAVAEGRVFTSGNEGNTDTVFCFDAATGREIWKQSCAEPLNPYNYADGRCWTTPVLAHGKVYIRNSRGDVVCVDLKH